MENQSTRKVFNMKILTVLLLLPIVGCAKKPATHIPTGIISQSGVSIRDPLFSFRTTYTVNLSRGRTMVVESSSSPWDSTDKLSFSDTLRQADHKEIVFDCDRIADVIIDADLVKEITPYCFVVHAQAKEFWEQHGYSPDEMVDYTGTHWKKVIVRKGDK